MGTVLRLALMAAGQMVGGRLLSRQWVASLALTAAAAVVLIAGLGFLVAAGFLALAQHYDTPIAASIVGGGLCAVAAVTLGSVMLLRRRRARGSFAQGLIPALAAGALVRQDAQDILAAFARLISTAAPATVAAALAGLVIGLFTPRARVVRRAS